MDIWEKWAEIKQNRGFQEFYFFTVALILAFGTLQTTGTVMDTDKPVVTVVSCSMYPELDVGDILVVKGTDFQDIEEGDIVVYSIEERNIPIVHRTIAVHDGYIETMGDNNEGQLEFERNVSPEQIHGRTVFNIPRLGLVKLLTMDLMGYGPESQPLIFDSTPNCVVRT